VLSDENIIVEKFQHIVLASGKHHESTILSYLLSKNACWFSRARRKERKGDGLLLLFYSLI